MRAITNRLRVATAFAVVAWLASASGAQSRMPPSGPTVQRATPWPDVTPLAAASGGNSFGAASGSKTTVQLGAVTLRSALPRISSTRSGYPSIAAAALR